VGGSGDNGSGKGIGDASNDDDRGGSGKGSSDNVDGGMPPE
jgi:hypothetical protein